MIYWRARDQAGRRGKAWCLSDEDFERLLERAGGRCEVTGVRLDMRCVINGRAPKSPSIDRVSSEGPYSFDNCRIVAAWVNLGMNVWGDEVIHEVMKREPNPVQGLLILLPLLTFALYLCCLAGGFVG